MKMRNLFWILAALAIVGCQKTDEVVVDGPQIGGDQSYVAINIKANDDVTRAAAYEDGTADEQAISTAAFFFFDNSGNPFNVNANGNYVNVAIADNGGEQDPNIESMTDPVVVVERYKGEFPSKIVAVLNYTATANVSMADLTATLNGAGHTGGKNFIMSNSVYMDATGAVIDATTLTIDNFQTSVEKAIDNPVTIYVERMTAKVSVNDGDQTFDTGIKVNDKAVYAKIEGWDLVGNQLNSYFVKSINPTWTDADLGFVWNDPAYRRSYWTGKCVTAAVSNAFTYSSLTNTDDSVEYIGEQVGAANTDRTKYIVAATLQDDAGAAIEVAQWYGTYYVGQEALLAAVAPTLKTKLMKKDGSTYTAIDDDQLMCVAGSSDVESYEVIFQLKTGVATTDWYSFDGATYTAVADPNAVLATIEPAKIWSDGMTYYYADVKHLGQEGKAGEYGIVRNHAYKVTITGVMGLGTPVYDPDQQIEEPEKPSDKETYISAQINVLSWRLVEQNVTLK